MLSMCDMFSPATAFPWWKGGTTGGSARAAGCVYSTGLLTQIHISGYWELLPSRSSLTGPPDMFLEMTKRAAGFDKSVVHVLGYCSVIWDDAAQIDELVHFVVDGHWCWSWVGCRYLVDASGAWFLQADGQTEWAGCCHKVVDDHLTWWKGLLLCTPTVRSCLPTVGQLLSCLCLSRETAKVKDAVIRQTGAAVLNTVSNGESVWEVTEFYLDSVLRAAAEDCEKLRHASQLY